MLPQSRGVVAKFANIFHKLQGDLLMYFKSKALNAKLRADSSIVI